MVKILQSPLSGELDGLEDVAISSPTIGQVITWDGTNWVNDDPTGGGGGSSITVQDEGVSLSTAATTLNFTGSGVTATGTGATKTITISGSSGSDAIVTIAAANSPTTQKNASDYVCTGSSGSRTDHTTFATALAALPSTGGTLRVLPGTYYFGGTVVVSVAYTRIDFEGGARINFSTVTGTTPVLQITNSNIFINYASIQGSGVKGNGVGIKIGDPAAGQPNAVHILHPKLDELDTGIEFGVQTSGGTESTGDCVLFGGRIRNCKVGVKNAGFVNYIYSPFISECSIGIEQTADRNSGRFIAYSPTINQWSEAAIDVKRGRGSTVIGLWAEHTTVQSDNPLQAIKVGGGAHTIVNFSLLGTTHLHLIALPAQREFWGLYLSNVEGTYVQHLEMTDEPPQNAIVYYAGTGHNNVIDKISIGDVVPSGYDVSDYIETYSSDPGEIIIKAIPNVTGSVAGSVLGLGCEPHPEATYTVFRDGTSNTYFAKDRFGHIVTVAADTATTSGFKAVMSTIVPTDSVGIHVHFAPNTRFHFLDAPLGNEAWAGSQDYHEYVGIKDCTFSGGGWSTIISNRTNWPTGIDTEVFSFTNAQGIHIKDLQVECCGSFKSTTGAIDFDQAVDCTIENVRILRSRGAQAIIFDGGDAGRTSQRNLAHNCHVQGRPQPPQLSLNSGGSLTASTEYRYCVAWVDMDLAGANTAATTMPSDVVSITTTSGNKSVTLTIQPGAYTVTARKVFRWDATNGWRLIATVNNNTAWEYIDDGTATPSAVDSDFTAHRSTIMGSGIEILSALETTISDCFCDGVGDRTQTANWYSFNLATKGTVTGPNKNRVVNCISKHSGSHAFRIHGGSDNIISGCTAINPGTVANKASFVRIEGTASAPTNRNIVMGVRGIDDQTSASPSGGVSTNTPVSITATNTPTNNHLAICTFSGHISALSDAGTGTVQTGIIVT